MKKVWQKPVIAERDASLEVTAYQSAELDRK
jgi:coenzyme PQQ precursor peptide PqqA